MKLPFLELVVHNNRFDNYFIFYPLYSRENPKRDSPGQKPGKRGTSFNFSVKKVPQTRTLDHSSETDSCRTDGNTNPRGTHKPDNPLKETGTQIPGTQRIPLRESGI